MRQFEREKSAFASDHPTTTVAAAPNIRALQEVYPLAALKHAAAKRANLARKGIVSRALLLYVVLVEIVDAARGSKKQMV